MCVWNVKQRVQDNYACSGQKDARPEALTFREIFGDVDTLVKREVFAFPGFIWRFLHLSVSPCVISQTECYHKFVIRLSATGKCYSCIYFANLPSLFNKNVGLAVTNNQQANKAAQDTLIPSRLLFK